MREPGAQGEIFLPFSFLIGKILETNVVKGIRISHHEEKIEKKITLLCYLQNTAICHEPLEIFFPFFICKQRCVLHKILHAMVIDSKDGA